MHGRPRLPPGVTPDYSKDQAKAEKLSTLLNDVIRNQRERCYTKEGLKQSAQLLEINPEVYTAWNYRKIAVQKLMDLEPDEAARKRLAEDELRMVDYEGKDLTQENVESFRGPQNRVSWLFIVVHTEGQVERALRANIKSYGAWHHRQWVIEFGLSSLDHEFLLLQKLLKEDARNFHGWNYRRFVVKTKGKTPAQELLYTTEKINENFSNYSAWHYRSTLLSQLVEGGMSKEKILTDEYDLVNQAYYTEPDDQSAWFYTSWLLGQTKVDSNPCLLGMWPSSGSTVLASVDNESRLVCISQDPLGNRTRFQSKNLPVVLTFNEVVPGVDVSVTSVPELPCLRSANWTPLASAHGPSRTWVAEFPLRDCQDTVYTFSLGISIPGTALRKVELSFNVQTSISDPSRGDSFFEAEKARSFLWPSSISGSDGLDEGRHTTEDDEATQDNKRSSEESQSEAATILAGNTNWQKELLENQIQNLRDLLEIEQHSKWAKLTLSRVLLVHSPFTNGLGRSTDEVLDLLKELANTDLVHKDFYESLWSSVYIKKVLQSSKSTKRLWWDEPTRGVERGEKVGWLRWSGLSLSKFDSVERMLWVQRLDISHNRLRNIEGLEALQLLVALDVSHNLIPSLTSLAVLRLNPQLQFLNISHNEIGSHFIDTSRYSFQSVLTNRVKREHEAQKDVKGDPWEVQAIFGDLKLKVLQISGNAVASDKSFKRALVRILQSLEILDGEKIH